MMRRQYLLLRPTIQGTPPAPAFYFEDTFTDADGTLLTAHTPDINPALASWSTTFSSATIESGAAQVNTPGGYNSAAIDIARADVYTLTCDIDPAISVPGALSDAGVVFRFADANNFLAFRWRQHGGSDQPGLELWRRVSGSFTRINRTLLSPAALGEPYSVSIVISGTTITATVGAASVQATNVTQHQTDTAIGLWSEVVGDRWDNLRVTV
ncbi:hypothetical protein HC928_01430 [bacterium]|nr:hypothetical protein [bacterium]